MCQKGKCYDFLGKGVFPCVFFRHFVAVEIHRGVGVVGAGRRGTLRPAMANSSSSSTTELGSHKLVLVRACRTRTITRHGPPSFPTPSRLRRGPPFLPIMVGIDDVSMNIINDDRTPVRATAAAQGINFPRASVQLPDPLCSHWQTDLNPRPAPPRPARRGGTPPQGGPCGTPRKKFPRKEFVHVAPCVSSSSRRRRVEPPREVHVRSVAVAVAVAVVVVRPPPPPEPRLDAPLVVVARSRRRGGRRRVVHPRRRTRACSRSMSSILSSSAVRSDASA